MPEKGFKHSKESKRKMSIALLGRTSYWKGKKFSKAYRKKLSDAHIGIQAGSKHPNWKGEKIKNTQGYFVIYMPDHPFCNRNKKILEHRLVMEKHLKRFLTPEEVIHHKGIKYPLGSIKNKQDNRIENLAYCKNESGHQKEYHYKENSNKMKNIHKQNLRWGEAVDASLTGDLEEA